MVKSIKQRRNLMAEWVKATDRINQNYGQEIFLDQPSLAASIPSNARNPAPNHDYFHNRCLYFSSRHLRRLEKNLFWN